jgi:hypothetical protein
MDTIFTKASEDPFVSLAGIHTPNTPLIATKGREMEKASHSM